MSWRQIGVCRAVKPLLKASVRGASTGVGVCFEGDDSMHFGPWTQSGVGVGVSIEGDELEARV